MVLSPQTASVFALCALFSHTPLLGQEVVLAGWHDFSQSYQAFRFSTSVKDAVGKRNGVTGTLHGGNGARNTWGSTDGSYGPSEAVGSSSADGSMSIRVDSPTVNFTIRNDSGGNLTLSKIVFDMSSVSVNAPRNLKVYYTSGGLEIPNNTLLLSLEGVANGLGTNGNYEDFSIPLSTLADQTLAPGQGANFRFEADTANVVNQAMALDNIAILGESPDFRIVTYNIHGGKGPNGEGDLVTNLTAFRDNFLQGEDVICLQEVDVGSSWATLQNLFPDYPHTFQTVHTTTAPIWPWQSRKQNSSAILSKHPFVLTHSQLIQTDPAVDRWERNAQHVRINLGGTDVDIFHYHNTYNFGYQAGNTPWSEREGLEKFRDYAEERLGLNDYRDGKNLILLGDYNLFQNGNHQDVEPIIAMPTRHSNNRDHITTTPLSLAGGTYATVAPRLSDHNAVWAAFDLLPPSPGASWATPPTTAGLTSITMAATAASDASGVEYYFANTSFPDQSRDSGWQSSPTFTQNRLRSATKFSYSVRTRDLSANLNESPPSLELKATTDDGDLLPNDWEEAYFATLGASAGRDVDDWDGDGLSDYHEWIAGTDPTDRFSLLSAQLAVLAGGQLRITWSSVPGKSYTVTSSTTLTGDWTAVAPEMTAEQSESMVELPLPSESVRFYRVEVNL